MSEPSVAPDSDSASTPPAADSSAQDAVLRQVRTETSSLLADVEAVLGDWFAEQRVVAESVSPAALPMVEAIARLSAGGKRSRAQLLYWGWRAAGGAADSRIPRQAAAGLELFQTAALIHDDIIDRSATRRGMPSVHEVFRAVHEEGGWDQDSVHFGTSAAVLVGDLALSWSEQIFQAAVERAGHPAGAAAGFTAMRTEVMLGQYLDIHAEVAAASLPAAQALDRALQVIRYKSAKYSAEHPTALGALLAGADPDFVRQCQEFALPVGEAFQIRDDILGVFGDPQTTGKPAGDDLREGKRTVLVGLHLLHAADDDAALVSEALGDQDLTEPEVTALREALRRSGALESAERMVRERSQLAAEVLAQLPTERVPRLALSRLAEALATRAR